MIHFGWGQYLPYLLLLALVPVPALAQSTATLQGQVLDASGAVVQGATIIVRHESSGFERTVRSDRGGAYLLAALPVGTYRVEAQASGFRTEVNPDLILEVGQTRVQDFRLAPGGVAETVVVAAGAPLIDRATISVGHVVTDQTVQEIPLNGRQFMELGILVPGSVTPPQSGFSSQPVRGLGRLTFNTAGNREEAVNFMINGITLNNLTLGAIAFQPSISTVQELKVENSTFSAQYGFTSGAIVNIATRSGTNTFRGELFEFLRNDALDARNFFTFTSPDPPPFERHQFGGSLGGPLIRSKTFFFVSYQGLRQRQGLDVNSLVLSEAERASVADAVIAKLVALVPRANFIDAAGTSRFVGHADAPVETDQWTLDVSHSLGLRDRLHGYYAMQTDFADEPTRFGNTIPGFGSARGGRRQIFTLNETRTFGSGLVNQARVGVNRVFGYNTPSRTLNPADFGINNGIDQPIGLPQLNIAGGALNFGGPANFPIGRTDTMAVVSDTLSHLRASHSLKIGGEFRQFFNDNFAIGTGLFNFPDVAAFLAGTANAFSVTLGRRTSRIRQGALGLFVQDNIAWRQNLTLEIGLRYDWNMTPTEEDDRFIVFDSQTASLLRVGVHTDQIYHQNNKNVQPRVGFVWDPFGDAKTAVRGAYALLVDQPITGVVRGTTANPPFATPLSFSGPIKLNEAFNLARDAALAPQTTDHGFNNASLQSWNLNIQRELTGTLAAMAGYLGSTGRHLILSRNINQPVDGVRPFAALSESSPILPGTPLGNITQVESTGQSSYHALWLSANKRLSRGLQFSASYTWSKSLDNNSLSTQGVVLQDSYDVRGDRGLSDYDVRHRFVWSGMYELPFTGHQLVEGWQLAAIVQAQSGNPVNIVTSNSTLNGVPNTVRPDVTGPIRILGEVDRWFDTSVFTAVPRFGNFGRNVIIGPGFHTVDLSLRKRTRIGAKLNIDLRAEIFDLFNHANFGQPGNVVGSVDFGKITSTRFPTGDSGSSRQVQLALNVSF